MAEEPCDACKRYVDMRLGDFRAELMQIVIRLDERWKREEDAKILEAQNLDHRLNAMNEIRDALKDQNATFVSRIEMDREFRDDRRRLDALDVKAANWQGRGWGLSIAISVLIFVAITAIGLLINHIIGAKP